jgi:hypothetical protein
MRRGFTTNHELRTTNQILSSQYYFDNFTEKPKRDIMSVSLRIKRKNLDQVARLISIARLNPLLDLHLRPINPVIYGEPYVPIPKDREGYLFLRWAWRLDAFSAYPCRTQLPSVCLWRDNWCTGGSSVPVLSYWEQLLSNILRPHQIGTELSHDVLNPAHVPL